MDRLKNILSKFRGVPKIPLIIMSAFVAMAIVGPFIAPYSPVTGLLSDRLMPPAWAGGTMDHLLGTDKLGRDIFSRIICGARISLLVSVLGVFVTGFVGVFVGLIAGYFGGWVDTLLMRIADLAFSLPLILMAVLLAVIVGPSFNNVILVVVLLLWPRFARQVRGETLSAKEQDFVALARVAGCSDLTIMVRHILPNVIPSLLVLSTLQIGHVIILEASLSFLGVGVPPPQPSWGGIVSEGRALIQYAWWVSVLPGVAILLVVTACNLLGDWIRDRLDPKLRQM